MRSINTPAARNALPASIKFGWAVGEFGVAVYIGLTIAFLLFYATQALSISPWLAGVVLLLPRLWDAFTDPLMGAISDRTKTVMGRRRPYLLVGSILLGPSVAALFNAPVEASEMMKALYVLFFYFLASTAITIFDVPYSSMAAEMTDDYRDRTELIGYKMMAARIGILMVLFAVPLIFSADLDMAEGFRLVGLGFGAFITVTGLASFFLTRDAPRIEQPVRKFSLKAEFDAIRGNKPFLALWLVFLFQNLAIGAMAAAQLYLLSMVVRIKPELIGVYMAVGAVTAMLATPVWVAIGRGLAKRRGYYVALSISMFAPLPILFIQPEAYALMFLVLVIAGTGDAANQLFPNAMVPDTVEVDELRTGERREGAVFGAWAFCRKLGMTGGGFIASLMLSAFGFLQGASGEQQPESALFGLRVISALLPMLLFLGSMLLLKRYQLSESEFNAIKSEIGRKRESAAAKSP
jgi:GPH family glycoside/pentoside/hexuronide:cation symporter